MSHAEKEKDFMKICPKKSEPSQKKQLFALSREREREVIEGTQRSNLVYLLQK